jgi:bacteriocin biosynthesis cyclodehydratase domain-containing protein
MPDSTTLPLAHILSIGDFGRGVTQHLKSLCRDVVETAISGDILPLPEVWPRATALVVASWRPSPNIFELAEDLSYRWRLPFVPVFIQQTWLRVGPVVVPGQGSCWSCWVQRSRQHAEWTDAESVLWDHYSAHSDSGPRGYAEPVALMAAARVLKVLREFSAGSDVGGLLWQMDLMTHNIVFSRVVGVHNCPRCGLQRPPLERSFDSLRQELGYLWSAAQTEGQ